MKKPKYVFCPNCLEAVRPDSSPSRCIPPSGNGYSVETCPCCHGWGEHNSVEGKQLCTLCGGKRIVIKKVRYEKVPDILKSTKKEGI